MEGVKRLIKELDTVFNDIEMLLYNYNYYKTIIKSLEIKIHDLMNGEELTPFNVDLENVQGSKIYKSDVDKRMDRINNYTRQISKYEQVIDIIDFHLEDLSNDKYFDIIKFKYFENKTLEEISSILNIGTTTVKRNKKRLIKELKNRLLPLYI